MDIAYEITSHLFSIHFYKVSYIAYRDNLHQIYIKFIFINSLFECKNNLFHYLQMFFLLKKKPLLKLFIQIPPTCLKLMVYVRAS